MSDYQREQISVPRDAEGIAVGILNAVLPTLSETAGVHASTRIPSATDGVLPDFVRIMSVGASPETMVTSVTRLIVEGWGGTEVRAQRLCALARGVLTSVTGAGIFGGRAEGDPAPDPHPDYPEMSRYACEVTVRSRDQII